MALQYGARVSTAQPDEEAVALSAGSKPVGQRSSPAVALVTLVPLIWLLSVTMTAGVQKIFHSDPKIGFLAAVKVYSGKIAEAYPATGLAKSDDAIAAAQRALDSNKRQLFNNMLDAFVAGAFLVLVILIVAISVREWILLLARRKLAQLRESDPVWLPEFAVAEGKPLALFSLLTLAFALAKELSGEAALERARDTANTCAFGSPAHHKINLIGEKDASRAPTEEQLYVETLEKRFNGIHRCC